MARLSEEGNNLLFFDGLSSCLLGRRVRFSLSIHLNRFGGFQRRTGPVRYDKVAGLPFTFLSDIWDEQKCALGRIQIVTASRAQCDGMMDVEGIGFGFCFQAFRAFELSDSP